MPRNKDNAKPWERQPQEGPKPFAAFQIFLSLGEERTLPKVAQRCTKNLSQIKEWSSRWNWVERSRDWDNELTKQAQKQSVKDAKDMRKRHTKIGMLMQKKAIEALENISPDLLDKNVIIRLVIEGAKLERNSRLDEANTTQYQDLQNTHDSGLDWSKLSIEDLEKLARFGVENE